jgi:hypothetical protein
LIEAVVVSKASFKEVRGFVILAYVKATPVLAACELCQLKFFLPSPAERRGTWLMAMLVAKAFIDRTNVPYMWTCSECGVVFSLDRITLIPSVSQIKRVNARFEVHCRNTHEGSQILGLPVPSVKEDTINLT